MDVLNLTVADLQFFYCEMAASTYAAGVKPRRYSKDPNKKGFRRSRGKLMYVDTWTSSGDHSFGETRVLHRDIPGKPLWLMTYQGWSVDDENVSAFLRRCLGRNYSRGIFLGGRGPTFKISDHLPRIGRVVYRNRVDGGGFAGFSGHDSIKTWESSSRELYGHWFSGSLLVPVTDGFLALR